MTTATKLSIKWCVVGMLMYVGLGLFAYFSGVGAMMLKPPPNFIALFTLASIIPSIVHQAMAAGAKQQAKPPV